MTVNKRRLTTTVLLFLYLTCFHHVFQAQEQDSSWRAMSINMSENGRYLAVRSGAEVIGSPNGTSEIWLYDLENLLLPPRYLAEAIYSYARMFFSPNNLYLAVGAYHQLSVFNIENNNIILELQRAEIGTAIDYRWSSFSPDSNHIVTFSAWYAGGRHEMSIWNIHTGKRIYSVDAERHRPEVYRTWLSPDWGQYVEWSDYFKNATVVYEFDIEQGLGQSLARLTSEGRTGAFSPDGSLFAFAVEGALIGEEITLQVYETDTWTLKTSKPTGIRNCDDNPTWGISHNNSLLVFVYDCMFDTTVAILNVETGEFVFKDEHSEHFFPQFTLNDEFLVGKRRSGIAVWNIKNDLEFTEYPGVAPILHPNSELMATIGPDGNVWLWNIKSKQLLVILPTPQH